MAAAAGAGGAGGAGPMRVCAVGGFCNRLRVLVSCEMVGRALGEALEVYWMPDRDCAAAAEELLDLAAYSRVRVLRGPAPRPFALRADPAWFPDPARPEAPAVPGRDALRAATLRTCSPICRWQNERFLATLRELRPSAEVAARLEAAWDALPEPGRARVGVHVRRTDHAAAIAHSRTEDFARALRAHADKTVLLMTDEAGVREELEALLGRPVATLASERSRRSREGMLQAAVDWFALTRCDRLLISYYSSFSQLASLYSGRPTSHIYDGAERRRAVYFGW